MFTNGVFDILHPGHVRYLRDARALGDVLIVGVNSDRSVQGAGEGAGSPDQSRERARRSAAALASVDAVVIFDEDTPARDHLGAAARHPREGRRLGRERDRRSRCRRGPRRPGRPHRARRGILDDRDHRSHQNRSAFGTIGPTHPVLVRETIAGSAGTESADQGMSSAPSLALRSLLTGVLRETGLSSPLQRISGATSPVRALAVAAAAKRLADNTILLVVPTDADIEYDRRRHPFLPVVLEGSADAVVEQQVLPFPSTQVDPYRGFQPHLKVASARARALHALATGSARVVVASAAALLTQLPEPAALLLSSCEITPGIDIDPHALANTLVVGGYEPADPVDAHGEFARRGGILDVFPAGEELPIRIEFIGDTVESIRRFDPGTQRSVETLDRFGIVPVRESASPETGPLPPTSFRVPAHTRCAGVVI